MVIFFFYKVSEVGFFFSASPVSAIADLHCFWDAVMPVFACVRAVVDVVIGIQKVEKKRKTVNDCRCYRC